MEGSKTLRIVWEYKVLCSRANAFGEDDLNRLGQDGWELVGVGDGQLYFKRLKPVTEELISYKDAVQLLTGLPLPADWCVIRPEDPTLVASSGDSVSITPAELIGRMSPFAWPPEGTDE